MDASSIYPVFLSANGACINFLLGFSQVLVQKHKRTLPQLYVVSLLPLCFCCFFFLRIWEKFVLPVSSCLHWRYRNSHQSSYFLDGGPSSAADVSNTVVTG